MTYKNIEGKENLNLTWLVIATFMSVVFLVVVFIILNEYNIASREEVLRGQMRIEQPVMLRLTLAREDSLLTSYGVVDSANAVYRIPISRAMELIAAQADNSGSQ
ncbi:MAG: hypothetical protein GY839_18895 [candidate division Zixibacteria bacterium]|nr:hypothetical protein [candidate division Zixibacteria bacterium]